jgi:hypothetical protein
MSRLTDDRNDPELTHGHDTGPVPQASVYLVLSEEERGKGFVRPVRMAYRHVGPMGPKYHLRDLTDREKARYGDSGYVSYEEYPETENALGRFWTQKQLDSIDNGCGVGTTMSLALAETYARQPSFYGATYCVGCQMHLPVSEFVWAGTDERVGS